METNQQSLRHGYALQGKKNRYVIDKVLGQGAFGITYLARYKASIHGDIGAGFVWSQVAIKEFFMRDLNTRDASTGSLNDASQDNLIGSYRRAFMREARNLAGLHHPNIVNVFEVIETNNTVYIVMEYINGGSLDEHIIQSGKLSEQESLDYILKLCSAVGCMHDSKMLHLDIKPKNVMLDEDGEIYLIDFGLSKQYTEDGEPESSTSIGLGTPGYAPVEQAEHQDGEKKFRAPIDIYALGATFFKMLTGDTPPKASQVSDSVIDGNNIIDNSLKTVGISNSIAAIVTKAMWPSIRGRYQTVQEFEYALNNLQTSSSQADSGDIETIAAPQKKNEVLNDTHPSTERNQELLNSEPSKKQVPGPDPGTKVDDGLRKVFPKWMYGVVALLVGLIIILAVFGSHASDPTAPRSEKEQFIKSDSMPDLPIHEFVDLGLSVKWATCNIGATNPEDFGDYYAWGETGTKSSYTWANYSFRSSGNSYDNIKFSKYNTDIGRGTLDGKKTLELKDDVAHVKWGGGWRMPTRAEQDELRDNCIWTWITMNGVNGYKVTGKKPGYTNRYIFLPAAGYYRGTSLLSVGTNGLYSSSSLKEDSPCGAYDFRFNSDALVWSNYYRYIGQSVRAVCQ